MNTDLDEEKMTAIAAKFKQIADEAGVAIFCCVGSVGKSGRVVSFPEWSLLQREASEYRINIDSSRDDKQTVDDTLQLLFEFRNMIGGEYSTLNTMSRDICEDLGIDYAQFTEHGYIEPGQESDLENGTAPIVDTNLSRRRRDWKGQGFGGKQAQPLPLERAWLDMETVMIKSKLPKNYQNSVKGAFVHGASSMFNKLEATGVLQPRRGDAEIESLKEECDDMLNQLLDEAKSRRKKS